MKKKTVKKAKKKVVKKKKTAKKAKAKSKAPKAIGAVTHFYREISVAIVKFNKSVNSGTKLHFKGATTDFVEAPKSMQYNHVAIEKAPKGKLIGIKVKKRVRDGDAVYEAKE